MADTMAVSRVEQGTTQFQGAFSEMMGALRGA